VIFQELFRDIRLSSARRRPPPMSGHLLSRTGAGTCMMRYGPKFYDGGVVIRYVTIASRGVKNEPEGHSFSSVASYP